LPQLRHQHRDELMMAEKGWGVLRHTMSLAAALIRENYFVQILCSKSTAIFKVHKIGTCVTNKEQPDVHSSKRKGAIGVQKS
jgi:hypothetical protein